MKRVYIVSLIGITAAAAYIVFSINSLSIALKSKGYSHEYILVLERGFNDNGNEFRIVKTSKGNDLVLVYVEKNNMGFWTAAFTGGISSPGTNLVSIGWMKNAGIRRYEADDDPSFSNEWHKLYYGDNAIKLVSIMPEQLPPGVALNIQQTGSDFSIHFISFEKPDVLEQIDVYYLLENQVK